MSKADVSKYSANWPAGTREGFSLVFKSSTPHHFIEQGTYDLENAAIGSLPLFLVPIGENEDGTLNFQAVFN